MVPNDARSKIASMAYNPIVMLTVEGGQEVYVNRRAVAYFERGEGNQVFVVMVTAQRFLITVTNFNAFWRDFDEGD
jgi:hypothetical protein